MMKTTIFLLLTALTSCQYLRLPSEKTDFSYLQNSQFLSDQVFFKLPKYQQLQQLILAADSYGLLKVFQLMEKEKDQIQCKNMVYYSNQLLGLIKKAQKQKTSQLRDLQKYETKSRKTIQYLDKENKMLRNKIFSLKISYLQENLESSIRNLKILYQQQSELVSNQQVKEEEINHLEEENEKKGMEKREEIEKMNGNKIIFLELSDQIQYLEKQLGNLYEKRNKTKNQMKKSEQMIEVIDRCLVNSAFEIEFITQRIKQIESKGKSMTDTIIQGEIQIQNLRKTIDNAKRNEDVILEKIQKNQQLISQEQIKLNKKLKQQILLQIEKLKQNLHDFTKQNNQLYYHCLGVSNQDYTIQDVEGEGKFVVGGLHLPSFLANIYGNKISLPLSSYELTKKFKTWDLFNEKWKQEYGDPFDNTYHQFSCLTPSKSRSYNGEIVQIGKNYLRVKPAFGRQKKLRMGSCSRIQMNNEDFKVGQTIFFNGVQTSNQEIELYLASCL